MPSTAKDIGWKLAAVFLAYALWLVVIEEKQAVRQLEVPVRFAQTESSLALVGDRPAAVTVRVQAAEGIIKDLQAPDVDVVIDVSALGVGAHTVRLRPDSSAIIPRRVGVRVLEVFPPSLVINLERRITAEVPVRPVLTGKVASGFEVSDITVTPPFVQVVGPQSAVEGTTEAVTREISVEGHRAPFEQDVLIDVENPDLVITGGLKARVALAVTEIVSERTLTALVITPLRGQYEARVRPNRTSITLRGPERLLSRLKPEEVMAFVDLKDLEPRADAYDLEVQVAFSRDPVGKRLEIIKITDVSASVRIYDRKLADDTTDPVQGG